MPIKGGSKAPYYLQKFLYDPVVFGNQSLHEVLNFWSIGELYLWNLNYRYRMWSESEAMKKEFKNG